MKRQKYEFLGMVLQVIICYPTGYLRWLIFRKKPLNNYLYDDFEINLGIFAAALAVTLLAVSLIKKFILSPF